MSRYLHNLEGDVKARYLEKMRLIDNVDPYDCDGIPFTVEVAKFPTVTFVDVLDYLVSKRSAYTKAEFKCYKSLRAYQLVKFNWVRDIEVRRINDNVLVCGKVLHSQSVKDKPLQPWFIAKKDGEILCGHCDCKAGLSECCTHVAAIIFEIQQAVDNFEPISVTEQLCTWNQPSKKVGEMSTWQQAQIEKGKQDSSDLAPRVIRPKNLVASFLEHCAKNDCSPVLMRVNKPYSQQLQEEANENKKRTFMTLFKEEHLNKSLEELRRIAETLVVTMTQDECFKIEKDTRGQAKNKNWFHQRAGRITASKFKSVCSTKLEKPAISTLKSICYPISVKFHSKATDYGCKHEKYALDVYNSTMSSHIGFTMNKSVGLVIDPSYPHFGASPDAIVNCDCCGQGCVEVKCPLCAKDKSIAELVAKKQFCLDSERFQLKTTHAYYYQIQMQIALTKYHYCHFVIWSDNELFVERISFNLAFWNEESEKATKFWKLVILPELLSKYYTREDLAIPPIAPEPESSTSSTSDDVEKTVTNRKTWCYCGKADDGSKMIKCLNNACPIQWFHLEYVGIKKMRKVWKCKECK